MNISNTITITITITDENIRECLRLVNQIHHNFLFLFPEKKLLSKSFFYFLERELFEEYLNQFNFTSKEKEILLMKKLGKSNAQIAIKLERSQNTIDTHIANILKRIKKKLKIRNTEDFLEKYFSQQVNQLLKEKIEAKEDFFSKKCILNIL